MSSDVTYNYYPCCNIHSNYMSHHQIVLYCLCNNIKGNSNLKYFTHWLRKSDVVNKYGIDHATKALSDVIFTISGSDIGSVLLMANTFIASCLLNNKSKVSINR